MEKRRQHSKIGRNELAEPRKEAERKNNRRKVEISKDTRRIDITAQQGTKKLKVRKKKTGKRRNYKWVRDSKNSEQLEESKDDPTYE